MPAGLAFFRPTRLKVLFVAEWLLFLLLQGVRGSLEGWAWTRLALAPLALFYLAGCGLEACSHQSQRVAAPRGLLALALALAGLDQMFKALVAAGLPLRAFAPLVPGWLHLAHEPNVYGSWLVAQLEPASPGLLLTVQAAAVALFLVSCVVGHRIYLRTYRFSLWADVACVGLSAGLASWIADALGRGYILDYIALPGLVTTDRKDVWLTLSVAALSAEVLDNPQLSGRWAVWRRSRQSDARLSEGPPDAGHQARFHSTPHTEGMPMSNVPQVPATWGTLEALGPLSAEQIEAEARKLLAEMTLAEKVHQMSGDTPLLSGTLEMLRAYNARPLPAGENLRLGIPGIRFSDGPRGVVMYHSTCFPVSMGRGATWDLALEERVGDAIGVEARSQGANFFGGVCINLLRHPGWGRAQETYGEDPVHLGEMGAALVRGVQRHVMACVKHYAANSIENSRQRVDVRMDERTLREVYLPHFRRCIDEGAASVMGAYNKVNGTYCCHHRHLLREVLKGDWGFQGFVISDFVFAVHDARAAVEGGLDIEMPFTWRFGRRLRRLVEKGQVAEAYIDAAVLRILRQKLRFAQVGEPKRYGPEAVVSDAHRALAREVAQASMVLLKNDPATSGGEPLLPIDRGRVRRIALLGRLATAPNTGDVGSSRVRPPYVVTPLEGLQAAAGPGLEVQFDAGRRVARAAAVAARADVAVVVAGYTPKDEGENTPTAGGDRESLTLHRRDEALIQAVAAAQPCTVVVLVGGGPIICEAWRDRVPAILMAWYPGMEGGHALADLLYGTANPGGKLPSAFPRSEAQLPFFDSHAATIDYNGYHGYRLMDRREQEPAFAFGFGLSYTRFAMSNLRLSTPEIGVNGTLHVRVDVANVGSRAGAEVVQLYVGCEASRVDRPVKELKGFAKVALAPGERQAVELELPARQLAIYDQVQGAWTVEPTDYRVFVGPSSRAGDLLHAPFRVRS